MAIPAALAITATLETLALGSVLLVKIRRHAIPMEENYGGSE